MIIHGDVAFMILSTVLVLIMTPGLALFYGGLVERKNSLSIMFQCFISIGIVTLLWILGGFGMVFGNDIGGIIGNPLNYFGFAGMDHLINPEYSNHIPFLLFFMYQLMFAIITAPLMTGAFANRITISGWIKVLILWMILIYFPVAHWVWGGGFLSKLGFVDYAGGAVIHISAGFGSLGGVLFLGDRAVKNTKGPFNLGLVTVGSAILLFGWFGFNAGGSLAAADTATIVFTNTGVASAFGMITWIILHYIRHKRYYFLEIIVGSIVGLATVTPCAGYITPFTSIFVGILGAIVCFFSVILARKLVDDALDVCGTHGMGGFLGTLLIGLLANTSINSVEAGIKQFLIQLMGAILIALYSSIVTYIIFVVVNKIKCIKVNEEVQKEGLDKKFFGESIVNLQDE